MTIVSPQQAPVSDDAGEATINLDNSLNVINNDENTDFSENVNKIKEAVRTDNADGSWYESEMDSENRIVKETYYDEDGALKYWFEFTFENTNSYYRGKSMAYGADGNAIPSDLQEFDVEYDYTLDRYWQRKEYDDKGNRIKDIYGSGSNSISRWIEYIYDDNDDLIRSLTYNSDGSLDVRREFDGTGGYTDYDYIEENALNNESTLDTNGAVYYEFRG